MDEYVSKGLTQGGISQMEFVQGLCIGYLSNHLYKTNNGICYLHWFICLYVFHCYLLSEKRINII